MRFRRTPIMRRMLRNAASRCPALPRESENWIGWRAHRHRWLEEGNEVSPGWLIRRGLERAKTRAVTRFSAGSRPRARPEVAEPCGDTSIVAFRFALDAVGGRKKNADRRTNGHWLRLRDWIANRAPDRLFSISPDRRPGSHPDRISDIRYLLFPRILLFLTHRWQTTETFQGRW